MIVRQRAESSNGIMHKYRPLVIRADCTEKTGAGHLLAALRGQGWRDRDGEVVFLTHCESVALRHRLKNSGVGLIALENPYPDPKDLESTLRLLEGLGSDRAPWLVLDGYRFAPAYHERIRRAGYPLLLIDDMAQLEEYHASALLNQNIGAERLGYLCDQDTRLLLGSPFALLRREFLAWRRRPRIIVPLARRVLVTMGGSDPDNITLRVVEALRSLGPRDLEIRVVIGPANSHRASLVVRLSPLPIRSSYSRGSRICRVSWRGRISPFRQRGSVAGSWRSSAFRRPCSSWPTIRRESAAGMAAVGGAVFLGEVEWLDATALVQEIQSLLDARIAGAALSDRAQSVVDGPRRRSGDCRLG